MREAIAAVASGDFTDRERELVERHTAGCAGCAEDYRALRDFAAGLSEPVRGEEFEAFSAAAARRAVNAARHIGHTSLFRGGILRLLPLLRVAAMLAVGFALGVAVRFIPSDATHPPAEQSTPAFQASRTNADYIEFLERSHLLLLGAAVCKPECSEPDVAVAHHQRRVSIELLLEAQNIRKLPDVRLRPQELRLIQNIESALVQIAAQDARTGSSTVREESGAAVCEISQRLGM